VVVGRSANYAWKLMGMYADEPSYHPWLEWERNPKRR